MKTTVSDYLCAVTFIFAWFSGIAIASGFWQTFFALFPPYGVYLAIERLVNS